MIDRVLHLPIWGAEALRSCDDLQSTGLNGDLRNSKPSSAILPNRPNRPPAEPKHCQMTGLRHTSAASEVMPAGRFHARCCVYYCTLLCLAAATHARCSKDTTTAAIHLDRTGSAFARSCSARELSCSSACSAEGFLLRRQARY